LPTRELPERTYSGDDIARFIGLLQTREAHMVDLVAPAASLVSSGARLAIGGLDPVLTDDGFYQVNGLYRPTSTVYQQLANVLEIPSKYLKKMAFGDEGDVELFDRNVNHWLAKADKELLVRTMWGQDPNFPDTTGVVRAVLSDRYGISDNLDTALAVVEGLSAAGLDSTNIRSLDLTEDKLYIRVEAPEVQVIARDFLGDYRSPFTGQSAKDLPVISAGIIYRNSEVGTGASEIVPYIVVQVCKNGMTMTHDKFARRHVGGRLESGVVRWSDETRKASAAFIKAQVTDATKQFLTEDYVQASVDKLAKDAGEEIADVTKTIEVIGKELSYSEDDQKGILAMFIKGGVSTSGGILQAVTAHSQTIEDADRRFEFNDTGVPAMKIAARLARAAA